MEGRPVEVSHKVTPQSVAKFHETLKQMDENYNSKIRSSSDCSKIPVLNSFLESHCVLTPYSFSVRKCGDDDCNLCSPIRCPDLHKEVVFQRQPTPRLNPMRGGHFYSREEMLSSTTKSGKPGTTDLTDLPSSRATLNNSDKKRDSDVSKKYDLKSWDHKKVRAAVYCHSCGKPRCLYSNNEKEFKDGEWGDKILKASETALYICGDVLLDNEVVHQKINLSCESEVERNFYIANSLKKVNRELCVHCGEGNDLVPEAELKLEGRNGLPICHLCVKAGKRSVLYGKANMATKRKEKATSRKRKHQETKNED